LRERTASPRIVLGGDTRESTPEICRWLANGLAAANIGDIGIEIADAGVIPTPGIAHLVVARGATCGIAVSASHNPYPDNGIKLIGRDGRKWSDAEERAIEARMAEALTAGTAPSVDGPEPLLDGSLREQYLDHLAATLPSGRPLAGLKIVLDAGNGAASTYGVPLFERLGGDGRPPPRRAGRPERQRELRLDRAAGDGGPGARRGRPPGSRLRRRRRPARSWPTRAGWSVTGTPSSISGQLT